MDVLAASPVAFSLVMAALGLLVGSFLNVVIHRLPQAMDREWREEATAILAATAPDGPRALPPSPLLRCLVTPRSRCPRCATPVAAYDNIPVVSWLLLQGRCRACRSKISARYPVIETTGGVLGALCAWQFGFGPQAMLGAVLCWSLLALAMIDYDTQLLPDVITLPLMWLGIAISFSSVFVDLRTSVLGAMAGYLSLWGVYWLFRLARGKEGMAHGDFKLLAAIGAWLGWQALAPVIVLSSLVGATVGLLLIGFGKHGRGTPIPFGPYLAAAGALILFLGTAFWDGWLNLGGSL